jgi:CubicO group peptidase (beta-lactamase class C family)
MDLDAVKLAFRKNFEEHGELGASVSIWKEGVEVLNLADGWCAREQTNPWKSSTIVPFYSATKALSSATLLMLLEENGLSPGDLVCRVWPDFPNSSATFSELLSHQCGLAALDQKSSVFNHQQVIAAIEAQKPNWDLGVGHGYHPRTFGFLVDEPVRLLTGKPLGEVFHERIAEPLGLELWIGLPESEFGRVATLYPGKMDKNDLASGFYKEFNQSGTLVRRAFSSPSGLQGVHEMNTPKAWQAGLPAMGGVGTAQSLAKFYQVAIGAIPFFSDDVLEWMRTPVVTGDDRILMTPTRFSCGFQLDPLDENGDKIRHNYGKGMRAFGHPGAGGSHAFGDPDTGISYAYIMNQMDLSVLPGPKSTGIIEALS